MNIYRRVIQASALPSHTTFLPVPYSLLCGTFRRGMFKTGRRCVRAASRRRLLLPYRGILLPFFHPHRAGNRAAEGGCCRRPANILLTKKAYRTSACVRPGAQTLPRCALAFACGCARSGSAARALRFPSPCLHLLPCTCLREHSGVAAAWAVFACLDDKHNGRHAARGGWRQRAT